MDNDQCLSLIEMYKHHTLLWDPHDKRYHNKNLREDAWREISKTLNIPLATIKKKMTSLLGCYRRERSRQKQSLSGRRAEYISKWFGFDSLNFLSQKNQPKKTKDTLNTESKNNENIIMNFDFECELENPSESLSTILEKPRAGSSRISSSSRIKKRQHASIASASQDSVLDEAMAIVRKTKEGATADAYMSFGLHIANELRKYDSQTLAHVKHAINTVIYEADIGKYDRDL